MTIVILFICIAVVYFILRENKQRKIRISVASHLANSHVSLKNLEHNLGLAEKKFVHVRSHRDEVPELKDTFQEIENRLL